MMTISNKWLWALPIAAALLLWYVFTPKPQPDTELQVKYAKLQEHAHMTDSLLSVVKRQAQADSTELSVALENLEHLYADTSKIKIVYEKLHTDVRAASLDETVRFSANHLPEVSPYK